MAITRRQFLYASAATGGAGLAGYAHQRGLRFPPFQFEPKPALGEQQRLAGLGLDFSSQHLLLRRVNTDQNQLIACEWRCLAPSAAIELVSKKNVLMRLSFSNISEHATLTVNNASYESINEANVRHVDIELSPLNKVQVRWQWPVSRNPRFAAIGDSGGDQELAWCLQRAKALGADFMFHLGDFNYQKSDYQRAISLFDAAPLPVYVSIGNHDFHDDGSVYEHFLKQLGPFNSYFEIAGYRFVNIDTAASFWPVQGGQRGQLLDHLKRQVALPTVALTHCPLADPDIAANHDIGSERERRWLAEQLKQIGTDAFLCGHIHIHDRRSVLDLDQIIVGQGLGHQDLIVGQNHSKMAIGEVNQNGQLQIELADLNMPMNVHCHPRSDAVKDSLRQTEHADLVSEVERACGA